MFQPTIRFLYVPLIALFLAAAGSAYAGAPLAPKHLRGEVIEMNYTAVVKLLWTTDAASAPADIFNIYMANGKTANPAQFTKIGESNSFQIDSADPHNPMSYYYIVTGLSSGEYSFYITAANGDGTSPESGIIHVYFRAVPEHIVFTTSPALQGTPAVEYVYDADAVVAGGGATNPTAVVKFEAVTIPQGATFDAVTGELRYTYTGNTGGKIGFKIKAYKESDPAVYSYQHWTVVFGHDSTIHPRHCVFFKGSVVDELGNPIDLGHVDAMHWDPNTGIYSAAAYGELHQDGSYFFATLNDGHFTLKASGPFFAEEYYLDAADVQNAVDFNTSCGDTITANFVVRAQEGIWFTSQPPLTGSPNAEYRYQAKAVSNKGSAIKYAAVNIPASATLDESTGELRYTYVPNASGTVSFKIKATIVNDPLAFAVQQWTVRFAQDSSHIPERCMSFYGTVAGQNSAPVTEGKVMAYYWEPRIGKYTGPEAYAHISQTGDYRLDIFREGRYILRATGKTFAAEYYLDAADAAAATPFDVVCGDSTEANFSVTAIQMYTISGTVTDRATNAPVMATVHAYGQGAGATAITDQNGVYTLTVQGGFSYYLKAMSDNGNYFIQYYQNSSSQTGATQVLADANKTGIDFALDAKPVYQNGISGVLRDSIGNPVIGLIVAYKMQYRGNIPYPELSYKTATDSTGYFVFTNLEPGIYVLQALHTQQGYTPGYYKDGAFAVLNWLDATQLTVTDNGTISGLVFTLQQTHGIRGHHGLHGHCRGKLGGLTEGDTPVENVMVVLIDNTGKISDYAVTGADGDYTMNYASSGSFTLFANIPGYQLYSESITLDYSNAGTIEREIVILPMGVTSIESPDELPSGIAVSVYPNPSSGAVYVSFAETVENATVTLYNHLGVQVYSMNLRVTGAGSVALPVSDLPAGPYFVRVSSGAATSIIPVRIVK